MKQYKTIHEAYKHCPKCLICQKQMLVFREKFHKKYDNPFLLTSFVKEANDAIILEDESFNIDDFIVKRYKNNSVASYAHPYFYLKCATCSCSVCIEYKLSVDKNYYITSENVCFHKNGNKYVYYIPKPKSQVYISINEKHFSLKEDYYCFDFSNFTSIKQLKNKYDKILKLSSIY